MQRNASSIAAILGQNSMWVSRRLNAKVDLTVADVVQISTAMDVDPMEIFAAALPPAPAAATP